MAVDCQLCVLKVVLLADRSDVRMSVSPTPQQEAAQQETAAAAVALGDIDMPDAQPAPTSRLGNPNPFLRVPDSPRTPSPAEKRLTTTRPPRTMGLFGSAISAMKGTLFGTPNDATPIEIGKTSESG